MGELAVSMFSNNFKKLLDNLGKENIEYSIIIDSSNIYYLTGYRGGGFLILYEGGGTLYVPLLEYTRAKQEVQNDYIDIKAYAKYPIKRTIIENYVNKGFKEIIKETSERYKRIGIDGNIKKNTADTISEVLKSKEVVDITKHLTKLRSIKSSTEIEYIQKAVEITQKVIKKILEEVNALKQVSELELVGITEYYMRKYGAEEPAFPTIIAFNENTAYPHAKPSPKRTISKDNRYIILLDLGAKYNGYCSDMTRTFVHKYNSELKSRIEAVIEAQQEAIDSIAPGIKAEEVDSVARRVLSKHGLDQYFIHGLGHGVGIDVHEAPALTPGSKDVLEKGMVVTVEPGIYFEGMYGIRVEDLVLVTSSGARVLTSFTKFFEI